MDTKVDFYIDGEFKHYTTREYSVKNPGNGQEIAKVPDATVDDVNAAVHAAKKAYYETWRDFNSRERVKILLRWADILDRRAEELTRLLALESGFGYKAISGGPVDGTIPRYFAGFIDKNYGDVLSTTDGTLNYVIKEPYGVVAVQTSFNLGAHGTLHKMAPAMAAGNTIVARSSDNAPLSSLLIAETIDEAGFPKGVANFLAGSGPESGLSLLQHKDVSVITFTGSPHVGKKIMEAASKDLKKVILELGGKSPLIIFADADIEKAALKAVESGFFTQGQQCCASSRILVERSVLDKVREIMLKQTGKYVPAQPGEEPDGPYIGTMFSQNGLDTVKKFVEMGKKDGKLLIGGNQISAEKFLKGFFFEPTIFEFKDDSSLVNKEEIFGPVISLIPFDTEEEAIRMANDVPYGLSASVWSKDHGRLVRVSGKLEAGTIWANGYMQFSFQSPWGGYKESGLGREFGPYGLEEFYQVKNIWMNP